MTHSGRPPTSPQSGSRRHTLSIAGAAPSPPLLPPPPLLRVRDRTEQKKTKSIANTKHKPTRREPTHDHQNSRGIRPPRPAHPRVAASGPTPPPKNVLPDDAHAVAADELPPLVRRAADVVRPDLKAARPVQRGRVGEEGVRVRERRGRVGGALIVVDGLIAAGGSGRGAEATGAAKVGRPTACTRGGSQPRPGRARAPAPSRHTVKLVGMHDPGPWRARTQAHLAAANGRQASVAGIRPLTAPRSHPFPPPPPAHHSAAHPNTGGAARRVPST